MTTETLVASVKNAKTLTALATALNDLQSHLANEYDASDARLEDLVDTVNLRTFGGAEPSDTSGIWSWDAENVLRHTPNVRVGGQTGDWVVEARKLEDA